MEKFTLSRQKIVSFGRDFKHPVQDCVEVAGPLGIVYSADSFLTLPLVQRY